MIERHYVVSLIAYSINPEKEILLSVSKLSLVFQPHLSTWPFSLVRVGRYISRLVFLCDLKYIRISHTT